MNKLQRAILTVHARRGSIIYVTSKDWTSQLVRFGQSQRDDTWTANLTHVAFVGSDGYVYESTIEARAENMRLNFSSGVKITPLKSWRGGSREEYLMIQDLICLDEKEIKAATGEALRLKRKKMYYPVFELVGTLLAGVAWSVARLFKNKKAMQEILAARNPLDGKNGMYCVAFLNHCFAAAGIRLIPERINESVCSVADALRGHVGYDLYVIDPCLAIYRKEENEDFNFVL